MIIMGWGGTSGLSPVAYVCSTYFHIYVAYQLRQERGIFFFVGPVTMILALIFEWILGNFFSMMVMGLFAVFWLSFGLLEVPNLALGIPFATPDDPMGTASREYNAAIGLYLVVWGFAFFTFFVFTTRLNVVLAIIFSLTAIATWILAGAYFKSSWGDYEAAGKLQKVSLPRHDRRDNRLMLIDKRPAAQSSLPCPFWAGTCALLSWQGK